MKTRPASLLISGGQKGVLGSPEAMWADVH